ncbi:30S ribosomal protein S21 [Candidatus Uhrbacteria bacterium]|nr:30S ribosomal protein S21 [Candidatus Uhrbacteria bacterium]
MAEVKRKKGETFDSLYRRFQRRIQASGKVLQAKKVRFHNKPLKLTKRRAGALRREEMRSKYEYELRTGKIKPEMKRGPRRG